MKKFTLIFSAILMLGLVSCSKAEMPSNEGSSSGEQTDEMVYFEVNGGMEEMDSDEKTSISLSGSGYGTRTVITNWSNGDEVDFFSLTSNTGSSKTVNEVRGVKAESIDGRTAKFSVHIKKSSADYYYAVYPSGDSTQDYVDSNGNIYATIPNEQRLVGSIAPTASPLCVRAHIVDFENVSMKFCPAYSLLRIQVGRKDTWEKIEVSSLKEGQAVAGKMKVVMNSTGDTQKINSITCPTISEGGKQYITLFPPTGSTSFENKAYFVSILPQNYDEGLRITFYAKDGKTVTSSGKTGSIFITGYQPGDLTSRIVTYSNNATDGERASFKPPYLEITGIKLGGNTPETDLTKSYYNLLASNKSLTLTYKTNCSGISLHKNSGIISSAGVADNRTYDRQNKTVKLSFDDEAWYGVFQFRSHETGSGIGILNTPRFFHPGVIKLTPSSGAWSDDKWEKKTRYSLHLWDFRIQNPGNI